MYFPYPRFALQHPERRSEIGSSSVDNLTLGCKIYFLTLFGRWQTNWPGVPLHY